MEEHKGMEVKGQENDSKSSASDEVPARAAWGSPIEFILACLNYAVGLGNVWRFPYLVYRNGGGAFLIPYVIMLLLMGLPIFFLEMVIGQYSGLGPSKLFSRMAPILHGLGICSLVVIATIMIIYQVIVSWTLFYTWASFDSQLGWANCNHDFNTDYCYSKAENNICQENVTVGNLSTYVTYANRTCQLMTSVCGRYGLEVADEKSCRNGTNATVPLMTLLKRVLASEEYYNDYAMGVKGATWDNWGGLRPEAVLFLLVSWVILYLCMVKGVASMGKVVYFTAAFPYIMLTVLLVRGVTLPGAYEGILYYITPKWEYLLKASVWGDAASQTFYALGIACGSLVTLASYNQFNNNCHRDAMIVGMFNLMTSVFAGFVVFSILGFLAHQQGVTIDLVVQSGPGLAFIAYPEAVLEMPFPQLWAILFFLMMFFLGLGSQFGAVEAINTVIIDHMTWLRKYNFLVTLGICIVSFILGLPMCFQGGVYLFTLLDYNTAAWSNIIIGAVEVITVMWIYGADRFLDNVHEMSINLPRLGNLFWKVVLKYLTPIFLAGILIFSLSDYTPASYGNYKFPDWVNVLGWMVGSISLAPLPIFAVYQIYKNHINDKENWRDLFRPSDKWGPNNHPLGHEPLWEVNHNNVVDNLKVDVEDRVYNPGKFTQLTGDF